MKKARILLVFVILGAIIAVFPGCSSGTEATTAASQVASVIRGNLTQEISAAGNLALAHTEDVVIDLFYPSGTTGTIDQVLVEEGDSVTKGQVLVTVDKSEWDSQLVTLETLVTTKQSAFVQAQSDLISAQLTLANLEDNKRKAVLTAQAALITAQQTLNAGFTASDDQATAAALNKAKVWYDYVKEKVDTSASSADWILALENAGDALTVAQTNYDMALSGYNSQDMASKKMNVEIAEINLAIAQNDLADVADDIALQQQTVELSKNKVSDAEKAYENAKNNLTDALKMSAELVAPFDGFITQVNVEGGDEVLNGTVAVQVADPDKFEAEILVSEMDIPNVKTGGQAIVTVDALPGIILSATVTDVAPTATISSGVVNYNVRVEVQDPGANTFSQFGDMSGSADETAGGFSPPEGFEMPEGADLPDFSGDEFSGQFPSMGSMDVELREGLTVTVTITVASRTDVLLVPNGAVINEGFQSYVQVVKPTGELEKRAVTVGINNWQYTEITDGVSEGEQVNVSLNLAPEFDFGGGPFFMGG